jgi:hypothetical protein
MRWYFAIDEAGGMGEIGRLARLAVLSAQAAGGLEPVLLYHGAYTEFCGWMEQHGVRIVETAPRFLDAMLEAQAAGHYRPHSIGHWLRVMVPFVERERELVLYTDCDVIFLRGFDWSRVRPRVFAAAPEFRRQDWSYFNSGVMLLNVPAMRASYPAFEALVLERIGSGTYYHYDDQFALNEAYRGHWERLDPICNWKPYWPCDRQAAVLHFHGPKPRDVEEIANGLWHQRDATAVAFDKMLRARLENYLAWCENLGDRLQMVDFAQAVRFAGIASALTRFGRNHRADEDLAGFTMFDELS